MTEQDIKQDQRIIAFFVVWPWLGLLGGLHALPAAAAAMVCVAVGEWFIRRDGAAFLGGVALLLITVMAVLSAMVAAVLAFGLFVLGGLTHCVVSRLVDLAEPWVVRAGGAWDRVFRSDRSDSASGESEREKPRGAADVPAVPSRRGP
jgi:hypothetical protein